MRRADRLFQIIQILRRTRRPLTADAIAAELETSKRTVYRDIADLMAQRVPIRGEAGIGYVLDEGYDLPPLMLTPDEIEAAVLGAQWVSTQADPALARAAQDLIAKIAAAVPDRLRPYVLEPATRMPPHPPAAAPDGLDMARTRAWIHAGRKIRLSYADELGRPSDRVVWPVTVAYFQTVRLLVAWCELRQDFRHFRADRVTAADFLDERYPDRPAILRDRWLRGMQSQIQRQQAEGAAGPSAQG
ncbi:helix-turn-helix transcriptional regulator [Nitrospirillum viridazoti]|uniref:Transcriptional regulator n=1 Tax=Nitrospirillum viridazoti CBAmc TaxID=1441467 RepID=A0A248JSE3_9PROT|nr:YafY family protein [Nitrospirillum amazonense]ASG21632.1 transcriptional regulator [Nitrospirillum amazonense CBAmc]TWB42212.1 putative DNA-binding transcriptional regulator YafY [Nitrospirillum amazonense]